MQYSALNTLAFADVPETWMSGANSLFNMTQQLSMAMGIALGAVALRVAGLWGPPAASGVIPMAHFHAAFLMVGAVAVVVVLDALSRDPAAGDSVRRPLSIEVPTEETA